VVLLLVGGVDRRILPALRFVSRLSDTEIRALHVSVDAGETRRLADDWMRLGLTWIPLHIHEAAADDLPQAVRLLVQQVVGADRVTVVVPELESVRWWHGLLHRRSGRRIARQLYELPDVTTVIVPFESSGTRG
jgi:hypothetical protein